MNWVCNMDDLASCVNNFLDRFSWCKQKEMKLHPICLARLATGFIIKYSNCEKTEKIDTKEFSPLEQEIRKWRDMKCNEQYCLSYKKTQDEIIRKKHLQQW